MVYLVKVYHEVQYLEANSSSLFSQFLEEKVRQLGVVLIAEELSHEAIRKEERLRNTQGDSTARQVATKTGVEHRFCDPNQLEREVLGIPSISEIRKKLRLRAGEDEGKVEMEYRKYWPKRERFWLSKIKDKIRQKLIFLCGVSHIQTFKSLLETEGCKVEVLSEEWTQQ